MSGIYDALFEEFSEYFSYEFMNYAIDTINDMRILVANDPKHKRMTVMKFKGWVAVDLNENPNEEFDIYMDESNRENLHKFLSQFIHILKGDKPDDDTQNPSNDVKPKVEIPEETPFDEPISVEEKQELPKESPKEKPKRKSPTKTPKKSKSTPLMEETMNDIPNDISEGVSITNVPEGTPKTKAKRGANKASADEPPPTPTVINIIDGVTRIGNSVLNVSDDFVNDPSVETFSNVVDCDDSLMSYLTTLYGDESAERIHNVITNYVRVINDRLATDPLFTYNVTKEGLRDHRNAEFAETEANIINAFIQLKEEKHINNISAIDFFNSKACSSPLIINLENIIKSYYKTNIEPAIKAHKKARTAFENASLRAQQPNAKVHTVSEKIVNANHDTLNPAIEAIHRLTPMCYSKHINTVCPRLYDSTSLMNTIDDTFGDVNNDIVGESETTANKQALAYHSAFSKSCFTINTFKTMIWHLYQHRMLIVNGLSIVERKAAWVKAYNALKSINVPVEDSEVTEIVNAWSNMLSSKPIYDIIMNGAPAIAPVTKLLKDIITHPVSIRLYARVLYPISFLFTPFMMGEKDVANGILANAKPVITRKPATSTTRKPATKPSTKTPAKGETSKAPKTPAPKVTTTSVAITKWNMSAMTSIANQIQNIAAKDFYEHNHKVLLCHKDGNDEPFMLRVFVELILSLDLHEYT